ncbi:Ferrous-iron efflux pump FieF [Pseudoalteromonas sp. NC201]|nr:Ferrous-iron efflux pump FieF [Pseudoalteromonas sp. NC201]
MDRSYEFWVRFSSVFTIIMVGLMIAAKCWAWLSSGSAAMLGSLTDSLLDISASLMNFFVLSYALRPADDDHRFGHGKAEALAGLGQAAFIAGSASLLAFHGVERIINPTQIPHSLFGVWVSLFAIVCTLLVVAVQYQVVKRTQSIAIKADSLHYKGDILLNLAVLLAVLLNFYGVGYADPIFGILVAVYLLYNSWDIAKESAAHLMDKELPDEEKAQIILIASSHEDVYGVHDLRTRQGGKIKFIQLHLELDDDMPLMRAHQVADEVVASIKEEFDCEMDVLIHQDPVSLALSSSSVNA